MSYSKNKHFGLFRNNEYLEKFSKSHTYSFWKFEDIEFYKRLGVADLLPVVDSYVLQSPEKVIGFIGVSGKHLEKMEWVKSIRYCI